MTRGTLQVVASGAYLPNGVWTTRTILRDAAAALDVGLEDLTGIYSRRRAPDARSAADLAQRAAERALHTLDAAWRDAIDTVVVAQTSRLEAGPALCVTYAPALAHQVADALHLAPRFAFDVSNACASMLNALDVVGAMIDSGVTRCALVVAGEKLTPVVATAMREVTSLSDDRLACLTLGDGAAAYVVTAVPDDGPSGASGQIDALTLQTYPAFAPLGLARPSPQGGPIMHTDMAGTARVALSHGDAFLSRWMQQRRFALNDFDAVVPHQASRTNLSQLQHRLRDLPGGERVAVINNLAHRGNTGSTSVPLAIIDALEDGALEPGARLALACSASGLTLGAARYRLGPGRPRTQSAPRPPRPTKTVRLAGARCAPPVRSRRSGHFITVVAAGGHEALDAAACTADDLDALLYCGLLRPDFAAEPAFAAHLAHAMGRTNFDAVDAPPFVAFDVLGGLEHSAHAGLTTAVALIAAGRRKNVLVVAADLPRHTGGETPCAAVVVRRDESETLLSPWGTPKDAPVLQLVQHEGVCRLVGETERGGQDANRLWAWARRQRGESDA